MQFRLAGIAHDDSFDRIAVRAKSGRPPQLPRLSLAPAEFVRQDRVACRSGKLGEL
jgi:hypothetical protein